MNRCRSAESVSPASRRCSQPPTPSTRCSSRSSEPTIPPISSEPSTISIGALSPTSSDRSGDSTAIADVAAISRVTRPSASVTRSLVRTGSRFPSRTPTRAPSRTALTLTSEARPGNKRGSCGGGGRAQSRAWVFHAARAKGWRSHEPATGVDASGDDRTTCRSSSSCGAPCSARPTARSRSHDLETHRQGGGRVGRAPAAGRRVRRRAGRRRAAAGDADDPAQPASRPCRRWRRTSRRQLPRQGHRQRADGVRGAVGRGPRHRPHHHRGRRPRRAAATGSWPGSRSVRRRCSASRRRTRSAPSSRPCTDSLRVSDRTTGRRHLGQVLAARRQLSRRAAEDPGPVLTRPPRLSAAPTRVTSCPPSCSCSTAIRWPTARSSRSRWRTSRPPPVSPPTRSSASPRC